MKDSKTAKASYHHGDLRAALIAEGLKMLEEREDADLSLREIARAVGVSATAVYRHFPDKEALRGALCSAAYDRMGRAQGLAAAKHDDVLDQFQATGRAYVRFALDHPALFRLMSAMPPQYDLLDIHTSDDEAGKLLRAYAIKIAGEGASAAEVRAIATRAWALVHGLAIMMLQGLVPRDEALIDAVVDTRALGMGGRR